MDEFIKGALAVIPWVVLACVLNWLYNVMAKLAKSPTEGAKRLRIVLGLTVVALVSAFIFLSLGPVALGVMLALGAAVWWVARGYK
jgi:hypothetical protein